MSSEDEAGDVVIMSAANADQMLELRTKLFIFPRDSDDEPREGFYVRHASFGKISQYQRAAKGLSESATIKALCELVADSVVDATGSPIYGSDALLRLSKGRVDRFIFMQSCVSVFNHLDDDGKKVKAMIEAAEKN